MDTNVVNSLVLAYVGDAVYEVEIRKRLVAMGINKVDELQKKCVSYVSARSQAKFIDLLISNDMLSDDEIDVYKRGRNSKVHSHPSNTDIITYKMATGFEAVIGYLYLNNNFDKIVRIVDYIMEV